MRIVHRGEPDHSGRGGSIARQAPGAAQADPATHIFVMVTFLAILVGLSLLGTLGVLFAGMLGLVRGDGGEAASRRSNVLMRWRIIMQALTIILFVLLLSLLRS